MRGGPERVSTSFKIKGVLLAFASAACISITFIAGKQAMLELSPLAFTPLWFGAASLWGVGFYLLGNGSRIPVGLSRGLPAILLLGLLNGTANFLLFFGISLGDPTLAAFFSRSETLYGVLLGALLLDERLAPHQWLGVAVTVVGTGLMTFQAGRIVWIMLFILLISNLFLALSNLIAKKSVISVPPLILSTARTILMGLMLGGIGLSSGQLAWPTVSTWVWIGGGAFFGPFLSYVLFYKALIYLDLTKATVIRALQPLFVALYSFLLFGTFIDLRQFAGGLLMIAGIVLMLWQKQYYLIGLNLAGKQAK